jgi:hypothetical protein
MPRFVPKSAWSRFCAIGLSGLILFLIASYGTVSIQHKPIFSWPEGAVGGIGAGQAMGSFQIEPAELDLKSSVLRTLHFYVEFDTIDSPPFSAYLFWSPGQWHGFPLQTTQAVWDLQTRPENGAEPSGWVLEREGIYPWNAEYPWEQYSLAFVFGFNRTVNLAKLSSVMYLSLGFEDEWKVTQTFHRIDTSLVDAVRPLGVSSDDLKRLSVSNFVESYELRIGFVRQTFEIGRGVLAFWVPSLLLGALLIVAWTRRSILETSEALTLFIGTGLATLPFIVGAIQLLPPRLNDVEMLFYLEIAFSITFAAWTIAHEREK